MSRMLAGNSLHKLTDNERLVLGAIAACDDLDVKKLSKNCGLRPHNVRYVLKGLFEEQLIHRSIFVNYARLGYTIFNMFFSLAGNKREALIDFLRKNPAVSWLTENSGDYRYELTVLAEHISELPALVDRVGEKFGTTLKNKIWTAEVAMHFYGYKQLLNSQKLPAVHVVGSEGARAKIEPVDLTILAKLRDPAIRSENEIARSLGVAGSTLAYRINRLKKEGVITSSRIGIAMEKLGYLEYQVLIDTDDASKEFRESFMRWCAIHRHVLACFRCFGGWEYKVLVSVTSSEQAFQFQDELTNRFPSISQAILIARRNWIKTRPGLVQ
ncbi:MAG: Lrp/AsnC family transcriptional regulator [Deltaproteobacteria bacterium]|nr:Lrp/AsnC family transcriptional regulator [Deltaproteobacteria bacterium]